MSTPLPVIGLDDLAIAALLLLVNGALSVWYRLGLERQLLIASLRMIVQLALVGLILRWLFLDAAPFWTAVAAVVMVAVAGHEAMARQERRLAGWWGYGVGATAMLAAGFLVTLMGLTVFVQPDPWYDPRFAIPLLGMILGNTLTGVGLGLHTLTVSAWRDRVAIETRLALGATRGQAMHGVVRGALRTAMIPIVNSMAATGLVFLPGMMTGQILAGVDPILATKYQLLVTVLIAAGTGFGVLAAVLAGSRRLTDARHRLRLDRLADAL
ncbi:MAG: iron export ABC transporter permease subunit FetB [Alphaproteobacteria bacterium]